MRRLVWLLPVAAALVLDAGASVHIPEVTVMMASSEQIGEMTGGKTLAGCTTFRDIALFCDCKQEKVGWKLDAVARAIPYVYLSTYQVLHHELLHVFDFRQLLTEHVRSLGANRFATKKACDDHAMAAALAFPDTMKRITRLSAARRDGRFGYSLNDRDADLADSIPLAAGEGRIGPWKGARPLRRPGH